MEYSADYPAAAITIEIGEVLRYLAYRKSSGETPLWLKETIEQQIAFARPLIKPWAIYSVFDNTLFSGHEVLGDAHKLAFGICSIGPELEEEAESCFREKEYLEGLLLDTIGTVAAENLAELVGGEIKERTSGLGLCISGRLSPGDGKWQLDGQDLIFERFADKHLKVKKNESFMMTPRKSLSFAYKLGVGYSKEATQGHCQNCGFNSRCSFKKDAPGHSRGNVKAPA
jgi:hypothetical protein